MVDIYRQLDSLPLEAKIQTHNELILEIEEHRSVHNLPDALIQFDPSFLKGAIAIELELALKEKKRNIKTFELYYDSKEIGMVLYLVKDSSDRRALLRVDVQVRGNERSRIFIGDHQSFLSDPLHSLFTASDDHKFQFEQILSRQQEWKQKMMDTTAG